MFFFFLTPNFRDTHHLMYKKSNLLVYKIAFIKLVFPNNSGMTYPVKLKFDMLCQMNNTPYISVLWWGLVDSPGRMSKFIKISWGRFGRMYVFNRGGNIPSWLKKTQMTDQHSVLAIKALLKIVNGTQYTNNWLTLQ